MKEKTLYFYRQGYNCSQCLLKAAEAVYHISGGKDTMAMLNGVNTGLGVGGICSLLIAGTMVFGLLFDETEVKRLRMKLLDMFMEKNGSINCCELIKKRGSSGSCGELVGEVADMVEKIIAAG
jgi:C_GCAxxG_C_C family probable redox protein